MREYFKKIPGFAIVTGSARGLGAAMTLQLAKEGYDVVINYVSDKSAPKAEAVAKEARSYGVGAICVQGDVSSYSTCREIVDAGVKAFGNKIAVLVNNAGIESGKFFADTAVESYNKMIQVEVIGSMNMTHIALPYMIEAENGCIIMQSSVCGLMGVPAQADYSCAKAGLVGFAKALAKEYGSKHIRVNCIAPGMIMTDMIAGTSQEGVAALKAMTPLNMLGDPDDIAECMSYIVNAPFLTGQCISPNGGLTI